MSESNPMAKESLTIALTISVLLWHVVDEARFIFHQRQAREAIEAGIEQAQKQQAAEVNKATDAYIDAWERALGSR